MALEVLPDAMRKETEMEGIKIQKEEVKLSVCRGQDCLRYLENLIKYSNS